MRSKLRFGILGFGIFAEKRLIPAFTQCAEAEIVAISSRSAKKAQEKAAQFLIPHAHASPEDLIANPAVDAVFIASPNALHRSHALLTAHAQKPFILEKPMAVTAEDCIEIRDVCARTHAPIMIGHCMRFNSTVAAVKTKLHHGVIGNLVSLEATYHYNAGKSKRSWLLDPMLAGGGPMMDIGVHCVDVLRFLAGSPAEVRGVALTQFPHNAMEASAHVQLKLPADVLGSVRVSFLGDYFTSLEVIGTAGVLRSQYYNLINSDVALHLIRDGDDYPEVIHNGNCYAAEIDAFCHSVKNGLPLPIPPEEGILNQRLIDTVYSMR